MSGCSEIYRGCLRGCHHRPEGPFRLLGVCVQQSESPTPYMPVDRLSVITKPIMTIYVLCGVDPFQLLFETILKNTTGLSVAPEQIVGYELIYF